MGPRTIVPSRYAEQYRAGGGADVLWLIQGISSRMSINIDVMTEFIAIVIATSLNTVKARPDHLHEAFQIFRPVTDKTSLQDILCTAEHPILEAIKGLDSSAITIQMGVGTILRRHF
jgi:hypothetical protein